MAARPPQKANAELWRNAIALRIVAQKTGCYAVSMSEIGPSDGQDTSVPTTRIIQEYVPGRQITIANVIANPDPILCERVGLAGSEAIGIVTVTPGESAIIAGDMAMKAADVNIGFLDRFSGTLVLSGSLTAVEVALEAINRGLQTVLGFYPARITRT